MMISEALLPPQLSLSPSRSCFFVQSGCSKLQHVGLCIHLVSFNLQCSWISWDNNIESKWHFSSTDGSHWRIWSIIPVHARMCTVLLGSARQGHQTCLGWPLCRNFSPCGCSKFLKFSATFHTMPWKDQADWKYGQYNSVRAFIIARSLWIKVEYERGKVVEKVCDNYKGSSILNNIPQECWWLVDIKG